MGLGLQFPRCPALEEETGPQYPPQPKRFRLRLLGSPYQQPAPLWPYESTGPVYLVFLLGLFSPYLTRQLLRAVSATSPFLGSSQGLHVKSSSFSGTDPVLRHGLGT